MMKKLLEKLGIKVEELVACIKCKKKIRPDEKICPYCDAWNDCCSVDPRTIKKKRK